MMKDTQELWRETRTRITVAMELWWLNRRLDVIVWRSRLKAPH